MAMTDINTGTSAPRGSLLLLLRLESNCDMYRVKARKRIGTSRIDQTVLKLRTCERGIILLAYENGDCPAISVPQNGSVAQEAPNLLNQAKVCHLEPIEKLACGMSQ